MDNTDAVIAYLKRERDCPPTTREIALAYHMPASTVAAVLRRLVNGGRVRQAGVAMSGGRTWTLTDND